MPLALSIAAGTLVSEDLACIAAGLLFARGELGFATAVSACFLGILAGDLLLFGAGRWLGRAALTRAPLRWIAGPGDLARASAWLGRRGPVVVLASRFVPGMRLPTYVAAGALDTSFVRFTAWFSLAAAVWTPLLVGLAALAGSRGVTRAQELRGSVTSHLLVAGLAVFALIRFVVPLFSYRGRRLARSSWLRATRWEFWPAWFVYAPVALWAVVLGVRHRGLTVFTAANPGIDSGGFVGESKSAILAALARGGAPVARFRFLPRACSSAERLDAARDFLAAEQLSFPIVVKPDVGERGRGVSVVRSDAELVRRLEQDETDTIVQEYVTGPEWGIFYARHPAERQGRLLSITEKVLPAVTADGRRSVERLLLDDPRGVCLARYHLARLADRLDEIPPPGTVLPLAEIGNHCRGALFLDAGHQTTPALERAVEEAARAFPGFFFGRFDVRAGSLEDLRAGRFLILELNGVSSEAAHIYDPAHGIATAWRTLFAQWRLAYAIGAGNRDRGAVPLSTRAFLRLLRAPR